MTTNAKREEAKVTRKEAANLLRRVASYLEKGQYDKVKEHLEYSPAGDGYGTDHHFIDFSNIPSISSKHWSETDLHELIGTLESWEGRG